MIRINRRLGIATRVVAVALAAILLGAVVVVASIETTRTGSTSSKSSSTAGSTGGMTTTLSEPFDIQGMTCPSGCSIVVPWGPGSQYPSYPTLSDLVNASWYVFLGNVTAVWTVASGTIPITLYNVTSTTVLKAPTPNLYIPEYGGYIQVGEVGGTAANSTMSLQGYPTLTVGLTYVFFLSPSSGGAFPGVADAPFAYEINHSLDNASFVSVVQMTQGGPQGLFYVQSGKVYSLDNMYPQPDSWIPTKVSGVPLSQFVQEIQADMNSTSTSTTLVAPKP